MNTEFKTPRSMDPNFENEYQAMAQPINGSSIIDALLRKPARIVFEIMQGKSSITVFALCILSCVTMMLYGFVMGTFSGGQQLLVVPVKIAIGSLLCGVLCLPSLYIFSCLSGGNQPFGKICGLLVQALALTGLLLTGFAPISFIFSQSTYAIKFMGAIHIAFWLISLSFGLRLLESSLAFLNAKRAFSLKLWTVIFILVAMQMSTMLRPLIGKYDNLQLNQKKFFLAHWTESSR